MWRTLYANLIGRIAFFTGENIAHIEFYLQGLLPKILAIYTIKCCFILLQRKRKRKRNKTKNHVTRNRAIQEPHVPTQRTPSSANVNLDTKEMASTAEVSGSHLFFFYQKPFLSGQAIIVSISNVLLKLSWGGFILQAEAAWFVRFIVGIFLAMSDACSRSLFTSLKT